MEEEIPVGERAKMLGWATYRELLAFIGVKLPGWANCHAGDVVLMRHLWQQVLQIDLLSDPDLEELHDLAVLGLEEDGYSEENAENLEQDVWAARRVVIATLVAFRQEMETLELLPPATVPQLDGDQAAVEEVQQETAD